MSKVILSYGMGVDSTVILVRWLTEPSSRDFDLRDLIVLTAQVGNEFPDTKKLCEKYALPLMREKNVRYVQIARRGKSTNDGIVVLDDSRKPTHCATEGSGWSLYDEMVQNGTVPQRRSGSRLCTHHFKGWPLDWWLERELRGERFRHVIGFNFDEKKRIERDKSYTTKTRKPEYPLRSWRMGRQACLQYLYEKFGEPWKKSCCFFCPYADNKVGRDHHMERLSRYPKLAAEAALMERLSMSLNPRQPLFNSQEKKKPVTFEDRLERCPSCRASVRERDDLLDRVPYALYHVWRRFISSSAAQRKIVSLATGSREACVEGLQVAARHIHQAGANVEMDSDERYDRMFISRKSSRFPCIEELMSVAPAFAQEKVGRERHLAEESEHELTKNPSRPSPEFYSASEAEAEWAELE